MLTLYIGNKNYSSWSMRPWVLLRQAGIDFTEVKVRFDSFAADSDFKQKIGVHSPTGKVPVLLDGDFAVWDTLAIAEYLAERFPEKRLWPTEPKQRARARSLCAEMHSGFGALRSLCTMNIEADLPQIGAIALRDHAALRADLARIDAIFTAQLAAYGGPMLFGEFSIVDAYYAPVCMRVISYHLPLSAAASAYVERVRALPGVKAWIDDALAEADFIAFEEPHRLAR